MTQKELNQRIQFLKEMHEVVIDIGDDEAYELWVTEGVPDCPSEDDFDYIAHDEELYNEVHEVFEKILKEYGEWA